MAGVLYYILVKPISYLPLSVLYWFSTCLYWVLYKLFGYRTAVVRENLKNSFPDRSEAEIKELMSKFYRHLCDLIVESVRMFSISKKEALQRFKVVNPEILTPFYEEGKSVLIVAGHYNNWEYSALILDPQIKHQSIGIYTPLSNPFFEHKFATSRTRFGMKLLKTKHVKNHFEENKNQLNAYMFGADQSPTYSKRVYWTTFLHQETPVAFGVEKYSKTYNYPIIFARIRKVKRGYYEAVFQVMEENPADTEIGAISEKHTRLLEEEICEAPEFWLWTHKRWKRKRKEGEL